MSNKFGYCVDGSCESKIENETFHINYAMVNFISRDEDFLNIESMSVRCFPQCGSCKCSIGRTKCTIKEEKEQRLIESGLVFKGNFWEATYPWIKDSRELLDNKFIASKVLQSTEKIIMKNPKYAQIYGKQIKDVLDREVARKLTYEEIENYKGPHYYLTHHEVVKSDSSTAFRIVFNSSLNYLGHCINDY